MPGRVKSFWSAEKGPKSEQGGAKVSKLHDSRVPNLPTEHKAVIFYRLAIVPISIA